MDFQRFLAHANDTYIALGTEQLFFETHALGMLFDSN